MFRRSIICLICLMAFSGCSRQEATAPKTPSAEKTLRIGLKPEVNLFDQLERYEPIAKYLSRKTGIRIELKVFPHYRIIVDRFVAEKLDGAFFGTYTYVVAHEKLGVEIVARPLGSDNVSTYRGLIVARKDAGIRNARDMKGKRFAFVDRAAFDGYIFPIAYFHKSGLEDFRKSLREFYFAGTHEDVLRDLLAKKADAGAMKSTVYDQMAKEDPRIGKELKVLAHSEEMPNSGLALRKDIDPSDRDRLKEALLSMHLDPEGKEALAKFGALRFIETTNRDFDTVLRHLETIRPHLADDSTTGR